MRDLTEVLIVEDLLMCLEQMIPIISHNYDANITTAKSYSECSKVIVEQEFDLILSDHNLTDGKMSDIFHNFRDKCPWLLEVPIIILTSSPHREVVKKLYPEEINMLGMYDKFGEARHKLILNKLDSYFEIEDKFKDLG